MAGEALNGEAQPPHLKGEDGDDSDRRTSGVAGAGGNEDSDESNGDNNNNNSSSSNNNNSSSNNNNSSSSRSSSNDSHPEGVSASTVAPDSEQAEEGESEKGGHNKQASQPEGDLPTREGAESDQQGGERQRQTSLQDTDLSAKDGAGSKGNDGECAEGTEESDCETQLDVVHPDPVAFVERLLKKKWVTDDTAKWTIFEDIEDELEHHKKRSSALWHFVKAFAVLQKDVKKLKKENRRLHDGGRQLQEAYLKAVTEAREAAGDVAYWKELATAAGAMGSCPGSASKAAAAADLEDWYPPGPASPAPSSRSAYLAASSTRKAQGGLEATSGGVSTPISAAPTPGPQTPSGPSGAEGNLENPEGNLENPLNFPSEIPLNVPTAAEAASAMLSPRAAQWSTCTMPPGPAPWDVPASAPPPSTQEESFSDLREALRAAAAAAAASARKGETEDVQSLASKSPIAERISGVGLPLTSREAVPASPQRRTLNVNRSTSPATGPRNSSSSTLLRSAFSASRAANRSASPGGRSLLVGNNNDGNNDNSNSNSKANHDHGGDDNCGDSSNNNCNKQSGSSSNSKSSNSNNIGNHGEVAKDAPATLFHPPRKDAGGRAVTSTAGDLAGSSTTPTKGISPLKAGVLPGSSTTATATAPLRRALFAARSSPWTPATNTLLTPTLGAGASPKEEQQKEILQSLPTPARSPGRQQQAASLLTARPIETNQQGGGSSAATSAASSESSARPVSQPKKRGLLGLGKPLRPRAFEVGEGASPQRRSSVAGPKLAPSAPALGRQRSRTSTLGSRP